MRHSIKKMAESSTDQIVTVSFFRYRGFNKVWGMKQMYSARAPMRKMEGMEFFKPLGTGSGYGYSIWPDFSVYGMLGVWRDESAAEAYMQSALMDEFKSHSEEQFTVFLKPISSRGSWSGFDQWRVSSPNPNNELIAALTRATLKPRFLFRFWKMVPRVSREHEDYPGLVFTKGVGEVPLMEQATFSIWESKEQMESFAMQTFHGEAVRVTRENDGFREEMFTRLQPYKSLGTWKGGSLLKGYLKPQYQ